MAAQAGGDDRGSLLAVIGDEDTVTGFLLAGVGNVDLRRKSNFLVVTESEYLAAMLIQMPLASLTESRADAETSVKTIEDAFKEFTNREDIAIIMINQYIANMIRHLLKNYLKPIPAVLEVPSKDNPYDPNQDSILSRVQHMLGAQ
ncbi:MAG: Vacuolar ATP synthase subunit F [Trebouxia sp. A1-2]|nr:MAG: Vacuolar ATP synthase subunit F [Trebouxia sp. A1-2]